MITRRFEYLLPTKVNHRLVLLEEVHFYLIILSAALATILFFDFDLTNENTVLTKTLLSFSLITTISAIFYLKGRISKEYDLEENSKENELVQILYLILFSIISFADYFASDSELRDLSVTLNSAIYSLGLFVFLFLSYELHYKRLTFIWIMRLILGANLIIIYGLFSQASINYVKYSPLFTTYLVFIFSFFIVSIIYSLVLLFRTKKADLLINTFSFIIFSSKRIYRSFKRFRKTKPIQKNKDKTKLLLIANDKGTEQFISLKENKEDY